MAIYIYAIAASIGALFVVWRIVYGHRWRTVSYTEEWRVDRVHYSKWQECMCCGARRIKPAQPDHPMHDIGVSPVCDAKDQAEHRARGRR